MAIPGKQKPTRGPMKRRHGEKRRTGAFSVCEGRYGVMDLGLAREEGMAPQFSVGVPLLDCFAQTQRIDDTV